MFKVTVRAAALARGVKTYYQLAALLASNGKRKERHQMMARRLWKGRLVPTLSTLDQVCDALNCEITDLVERVPNKKRRKFLALQNGTHSPTRRKAS